VKTIAIEQATGTLSELMLTIDTDSVIVTRDGNPVAALVPFDDLDHEAASLSRNPQFISIIERSRERFLREGGISSDALRREFAAPVGTMPSEPKGG
jgi:prevent-host-death family protein